MSSSSGSGATDRAARERVTALLTELGVEQPLTGVTDLTASLGVVQGVLADRVVDLAVTESGRRRLRAELRGRRWAEERQVGVPEVLAAVVGGPRWTEAAVDAAMRIAPLPAPPGSPWQPPVRPPLSRARTSVGTASRLVRAGVRLGEVRAVRAAAGQLPLSEVTHGDFRAANAVLDDGGRMVVLEWAGVRPGPRHRDLITLWATTGDDDDRAAVARVVLDRTAGWEEPDVGLLWHAVALEQLVERITRRGRADGLGLGFCRARLADARGIAAELGSPVRAG